MKRTFTALALVGAVALGGATASVAASADAGLNEQDRLFLRSAHQGNLAELSAARIAQQKSTTRTVRDLAARWLTDHTALDLRLTQAALTLDVVLPAEPDAAQEAVEAQYRAAAAADFDELWVSTQITAHHQASALVEAELRRGSSAEVKTLAREAQPVIAAHHRLLASAAPAAGVVVPAEGNAPPPGAVRTATPSPATPTTAATGAPSAAPSSAAPTGWRVTESPGTPGWTRPSPGMTGATIPIPGGPGPSITVGSR
ncbi:DUF4142 domain-containing protein [Cryptosporangium sp. NPDC048952]|uniref:DUF4142 domain-containing protein n=1 Tax=Cryptosporangium sp. NPDC048952 TaxID=3363961 RepID=UPI003720E4AA